MVELKKGKHNRRWVPWSFYCQYEKALEVALRENIASDIWKYRVVSFLRDRIIK